MAAPSSNSPQPPNTTPTGWRALPPGIWVLGFGSLFMDISSELIHSLLPIFLVTGLGASMLTVGFVEGVAEATASIVKVFSGALSDYFRKRKFLLVFGYALAAFTKPIFPLATSVNAVLAARFFDRVGKGIRVAPRDALVADLSPPHLRGAGYGLRQTLDSIGALLGPLLAVVLMIWLVDDIRTAMWFAVIPAFIAVGLLIFCLREPEHKNADDQTRKKLSFADAKRLPSRYWLVVVLGGIFTLARFSEAFLVLRAQDVGLAISFVPVVMIVMNATYAAAAYPAGAAADRMNPRTLLFIGLVLLIAADMVLAFAGTPTVVFIGAGLWGLHMAFTQGLLLKLVADTAPAELIGTSFGIFNLATGVALLFASVIAGWLWGAFGASATFMAGAGFAVVASIGLLAVMRHKQHSTQQP
jgi:MFS family permease